MTSLRGVISANLVRGLAYRLGSYRSIVLGGGGGGGSVASEDLCIY